VEEMKDPCTTDILDAIDGTIVNIRVKLDPVLTSDPTVNAAEEKQTSKRSLLRYRIEDILAQLNILFSRIEL
jgi:hypothetical protein